MALKKRPKKKPQIVITHPDYGDTEINHLALIGIVLAKMTSEERYRTFSWFKAKFSKDWPSDGDSY